jgi:hypothetical protein
LETVRRVHDEWVLRQPSDAATFGGSDGNLYFSGDAELWRAFDALRECDADDLKR